MYTLYEYDLSLQSKWKDRALLQIIITYPVHRLSKNSHGTLHAVISHVVVLYVKERTRDQLPRMNSTYPLMVPMLSGSVSWLTPTSSIRFWSSSVSIHPYHPVSPGHNYRSPDVSVRVHYKGKRIIVRTCM